MTFPYFVNKAAPVSKVKSLMDYEVTFIGEIDQGKQRFTMKVLVPVTSLCPCSKKISDYGAHNQRSHVTVTARTKRLRLDRGHRRSGWRSRPRASSTACSSARTRSSSPSAPTTIRSSSRTWCATSPRSSTRTSASTWYVVESENFESIHNHSAYALIEKDKTRK